MSMNHISAATLHKSFICLNLLGAISAASTPAPDGNTNVFALFTVSSARAATAEEIAQTLFNKDTEDAAFQTALTQARAVKVADQVIFEARLLRSIRNDDTSSLAKMADDGEAQKYLAAPDLGSSRLFKDAELSNAILHGLRALSAGAKGDAATFEREIKDAFWRGPDMANLFAGWAQAFQAEQRMANLTLPLDLPLKTYDGKTTTLKQLLGTNKALLIDFWASWCGPCMALMPELKAKGEKLKPQGVVVLGMNTENDAAKATKVKQDKGINLPWLLEPGDEPYSKALQIDSIPRMILISPEGKVLYNGHPSDAKLGTALAKIGVTL